jgi:hypothetical protein
VASAGRQTVQMIRMAATVAVALAVSLSFSAGSAASPPCRLSEFSLALGPYVSEATQQRTLALRVVNHGMRTCVLDGYPVVTFSDAAGVIPFVIRHHDQMISAPSTPRGDPSGSLRLLGPEQESVCPGIRAGHQNNEDQDRLAGRAAERDCLDQLQRPVPDPSPLEDP